MKTLLTIAALTCTISSAHAQLQTSRPLLYAPRAAIESATRAPWPIPPAQPPLTAAPPAPPSPFVGPPGPPAAGQSGPPTAQAAPPATHVQPPRNKLTSGLPRGHRPQVPCPDGCPREPDDIPNK
jgi:hypothetical protein